MRILLLTHYWAPEVGAPQRRWNRLAEALISRGHELAVLAPAPHYPGGRLLPGGAAHVAGSIRRDVTGAMVHRTIFRPYSSGVCGRGTDQMVAAADSVRLGVARFRGANRPDVILGSVPGLPTLPAALAVGRVLHRPVVVELRDAWPDLLLSAAQWSEPATCPSTLAWAHRARRLHIVDHGTHSLLPPLITRLEREAAAVVTTTDSFAQVLRSRGIRRVVTVRNTGAVAGDEVGERVDDGFEERDRDADGQRDPEGVAQAPRVLDLCGAALARDRHADREHGADQRRAR